MAVANIAAFNGGKSAPAQRGRDLFELWMGYGLILIVLWTPNPWQRLLYPVAIVFILAVTWRSFDGWAVMGLCPTNFLRSVWIIGVALLAAAVSIAVAAHLHTLRPWHGPVELVERFWGYALWAFAQQFLLQDFFLLRLLRLLSKRRLAVLAAACMFAAAHLPNPVLTPITFVWGLTSCVLFLRYRNLYPLAIAHAIFGICFAITVPGQVTHNMRAGLGYLTYRPNHVHHRHIQLLPQPY